jgi:predicted transposase/invertase (TIGR01784 family)
MKTDTLFYEIFQTQPGLLLELLGRDVAEIANYDFRSVEVKQTAFRIDGLLIPKRSGTPSPVYFSEVQFQKDPQLYHRFFAEIFTYLKQYPNTPSWHGILIYPRRSLVPPRPYWELYRTLLESDQVTHIYLEAYGKSTFGLRDYPTGGRAETTGEAVCWTIGAAGQARDAYGIGHRSATRFDRDYTGI